MNDGARRGRMTGLTTLWVFLVLIWIACAGTAAPASVATGAVVALIIAAFVTSRSTVWSGVALTPRSAVALARFLAAFLVALVRSNIAVLRQVYAPMPHLRPVVTTAPVALTSAIGRLVLTHAVTLTPGSLTIDLIGDRLRVHLLDAAPEDLERARADVSAGMERHLARAFG